MTLSTHLRFDSALLLTLVCLASGCPDDPSGEGGSGDSGDSSGTTAMTAATMTAATMTSADSTGSTGVDESSSGSASESSGSTGASGMPEIEVSIEMSPVASGDGFDIADTVDVGVVGTPVTVTIDNVGTGDLAVNGVSVIGGDDAHFTLDTAALDAVVAPAGSTAFTIAFSPVNGGSKQLTVSIDNDDADEAPYEFTVGAHSTPNTYRTLAPASSPPARFNASMVDLQDGRLLLFGGREVAGDALDDTWIYDVEAGTWTELVTATTPPFRFSHAMAYGGGDAVVMFGGFANGSSLQDTWTFDVVAEDWTMMAPAAPPVARYQHQMVSVGPDTVVSFGGRNAFGNNLGDTWSYDAAADTWIDLAPATSPSPRSAMAMGYDGVGTVVAFGGYNDVIPGVPLDETWTYDVAGNDWTQGAPVATPGARFGLEGAHFANGTFIVSSGKLDSCCVDPSAGTFAYDAVADDWTDLAPATEPTPRFNYAMAYVAGTNKAIIFGGNFVNIGSGGAVDETVEYVGPRP